MLSRRAALAAAFISPRTRPMHAHNSYTSITEASRNVGRSSEPPQVASCLSPHMRLTPATTVKPQHASPRLSQCFGSGSGGNALTPAQPSSKSPISLRWELPFGDRITIFSRKWSVSHTPGSPTRIYYMVFRDGVFSFAVVLAGPTGRGTVNAHL